MPTYVAQRAYIDDGPAPRKFVLVISCIDCRLMDDLVRFLDHDNLTNRYYHIAFAGTGLCLTGEINNHPEPRCGRPDFRPWCAMLEEHLKVVFELTGGKIEDIYIIEHRDCGAYAKYLGKDYYPYDGKPKLDEEKRDHTNFAHALRDELQDWFDATLPKLAADLGLPSLRIPHIHSFLMGVRGEVESLDPAKPKRRRNSFVRSRLHQQPQRVAEELRQAHREAATVGTVDDAVVVGQAQRHHQPRRRSARPARPAAASTATARGSRLRGSSRSA